MSLNDPTTSATLVARPSADFAAVPAMLLPMSSFMAKNCFAIWRVAVPASELVSFIWSLNFARSTLMGILRLGAGMGISDKKGRQDFAGDQDIGGERLAAHMGVEQRFHFALGCSAPDQGQLHHALYV